MGLRIGLICRDVLANGVVVGRIMKAAAKPADPSWLWTLAYGYHENRTPTHGYEPTREAAMPAFEKSWRGSEVSAIAPKPDTN